MSPAAVVQVTAIHVNAAQVNTSGRGVAHFPDAPAFDAEEFDALSEMIGADGVREMVDIFEVETRQRIERLSAGGQDIGTQKRELHTLKGAASTVAASRLSALAVMLEGKATHRRPATPDDIEALSWALEAYLTTMQSRNEALRPSDAERAASDLIATSLPSDRNSR